MRVLGIETSCDDTCVAIIDSEKNVLSNLVTTQHANHKPFQGIVPEIAARCHMNNIDIMLDLALNEAKLDLESIDAISVTSGPGLIGGLIVGVVYAKALSSVLRKPIISVNHLEAHLLTARLTNNVNYPYLALLVSGGHSQFVFVEKLGKYKLLGQTLDDSIGEAYDKVGKMLGFDFPGGPFVEKEAINGNENGFTFPKPMFYTKDSNMSFSGLKTAIYNEISNIGVVSKQEKADIAANFQRIVAEIMVMKTKFAMKQYENICSNPNKRFVICGGVASNNYLRFHLRNIALEFGYEFIAPEAKFCTDNGVMVAFAGLERLKAGIISKLDFAPRARWPLEEIE